MHLHQPLELRKLPAPPTGRLNNLLLRNCLRGSRQKIHPRPHFSIISADIRHIPLKPPKIDLVQPPRKRLHFIQRYLPVQKSVNRNLRIKKHAVTLRNDSLDGLLQGIPLTSRVLRIPLSSPALHFAPRARLFHGALRAQLSRDGHLARLFHGVLRAQFSHSIAPRRILLQLLPHKPLEVLPVLSDLSRKVDFPRLPEPFLNSRNIPGQHKNSKPLGQPRRILLQNSGQLIVLNAPGFIQPIHQNTFNRALSIDQMQERSSEQNIEHLIHTQRPDILCCPLRAVILKTAISLSFKQARQIFPIVRDPAGQQISQRLHNRLRTVQHVLSLFAENGRRDPPVIVRVVRRKSALPDPRIAINDAYALPIRVIQPVLHLLAQPGALDIVFLQKEHLPGRRKKKCRKRFLDCSDLSLKFTILTSLQHLDQQADLFLEPLNKLRILQQRLVLDAQIPEFLPLREIQPLPAHNGRRRRNVLLKKKSADITSAHSYRDTEFIEADPTGLYSIPAEHGKHA